MSHETARFVVTCVGKGKYPEDDPSWGYYFMQELRCLGHCGQIDDAIALAEYCVSHEAFYHVDDPDPAPFTPEYITVNDASKRLVLGGRVSGATIEWCAPVSSDDQAKRVQQQVDTLLSEAAVEHGWDNYSTARGLRARAALIEIRLVDPAWRVDAIAALQVRAQSIGNPAVNASDRSTVYVVAWDALECRQFLI